jgi:hypothetical protein
VVAHCLLEGGVGAGRTKGTREPPRSLREEHAHGCPQSQPAREEGRWAHGRTTEVTTSLALPTGLVDEQRSPGSSGLWKQPTRSWTGVHARISGSAVARVPGRLTVRVSAWLGCQRGRRWCRRWRGRWRRRGRRSGTGTGGG